MKVTIKPKPSKRDVMDALCNVLVMPNWEYREHGPDTLGWRHCVAEIDLDDGAKARLHVAENASVYTLRRRMIETAECFVGRES